MTPVLVSAIDTPFGGLLLASRDGCFIAAHGPASGIDDALGWGAWRWGDVQPAGRAHRRAHEQIEAYCGGSPRPFTLPIAPEGSPLQQAAWRAACAVPFATSRTYGAIAEDIGLPGRARAVGRAMALCPLPFLIPLHRVVAAGERRCGDIEDWQRRMSLLAFERSCVAATASRPARTRQRRERS
jgi:methylated-DNA-[protein]-cysteine S-methyltransferase